MNRKLLLSAILMIGTFSFSSAQFSKKKQFRYSIDSIPEELKKGADAVYFIDEGRYEIQGLESAKYKTRYVVAIFNKNAKSAASLSIFYDKFRRIESMSGTSYDANGIKIQHQNLFDAADQSSVSDFSIFEDDRVKYINLEEKEYPYIVEFEYVIDYKQTFHMPDWYVMPNSRRAVMKSNFVVISPPELEPNLLIKNSSQKFDRREDKIRVVNTISFENLPAIKREPYGPSVSELTPMIHLSPGKFSFDGYEGDFSSWQSAGQWQLKLNQGREQLPVTVVEQIRSMTRELSSKEEKIRAVYEYVQNNTRYVSIQLGIGGWQPFPAETVNELGYGDCKGLSNYTRSLLGAAGIESHYTWVYGGDNPPALNKEFPYNAFNHIILCVPNEQDTIWLECTSQTNPFGYLGDFTGDRDVMIVTDAGGKIVHTTSYGKTENQQNTVATVEVFETGNADAKVEVKYTGEQHENNNLSWKVDDGNEELKKWVYANTGINEFRINDLSFDFIKDRIPVITETIDISIHALASKSGNRLFLQPNLMNRWRSSPKRVKDRKTDVILSMEFQDSDSIIYLLPPQFHVEYLPEPIQFESDFGTYNSTFSFKDNQLIYVRKITHEKGRFPKESYEDFRSFYRKMIKADKTKVVFVDKT